MDRDINLLTQKKKPHLNDDSSWIRRIRLVAFLLLFAVAFFSILLFILRMASALPSLKNQEDQLISQVKTYSKKQTKVLFIKERLSNISEIIAKRSAFDKKIDELLQEIPSDVSIDTLQLDKLAITVTLSSPSVVSLNSIVDKFVNDAKKQKNINSVTMSSLVLDPKSRRYSLGISIELL